MVNEPENSHDIENEEMKKDNHELEANLNDVISAIMLTEQLAYLAPFLCLARASDISKLHNFCSGLSIKDIEVLGGKASTLLRLEFLSETSNGINRKETNSTIYIFRSISTQVFEPFICITEYGKQVFAYANDKEFICESFDGDHREIMQAILNKSLETGKQELYRYVKIMIQHIDDSQKIKTAM